MEEGSLVFAQKGHAKHKYFVKFKFSSHQTLLLQNIAPQSRGTLRSISYLTVF
jgi:hypothetical protein